MFLYKYEIRVIEGCIDAIFSNSVSFIIPKGLTFKLLRRIHCISERGTVNVFIMIGVQRMNCF
jgi:hypothetical protein